MVSGISTALILFLGGIAAGLAAVVAAAFQRPRLLTQVANRREWTIALKIVCGLVMIVLIIYMRNAERYSGVDFIYGRF